MAPTITTNQTQAHKIDRAGINARLTRDIGGATHGRREAGRGVTFGSGAGGAGLTGSGIAFGGNVTSSSQVRLCKRRKLSAIRAALSRSPGELLPSIPKMAARRFRSGVAIVTLTTFRLPAW
jgi:hypothetical protein